MSAKLVAMQARAFPPPCLPGLAGAGRNDLFRGSVGRRGPAGRGGAVRAVDGPSAAAAVAAGADIPPAQVTWQIVVGAVAGVTPFVVAGVEFGKRIIAQKKCEVCGGSGLVMKNDYYVRCQGCVLEKILQRLKMVMRHLDHYYQSTTTSKDGQGKKCEAK